MKITSLRSNSLLTGSLVILLLFSLAVFFDTKGFYETIESLSVLVRKWFGGFYLYLGLGSVLFILIIAISPLGKRKLGRATDTPEHSRWAWISMLYSAGMGAGILLRAVQEPVFMQQNPPINTNNTLEIIALEYTFYQWGFTAWAFYGVFAIVMGYYLFVKDKKVLISSTIQDTIRFKFAKNSIDVLVIITTVFGLIAAVGLGTTQINGGINHLSGGDYGLQLTIALCLLISALAFISVWKGVNKGLKVISKLNIIITLIILLFVFAQSAREGFSFSRSSLGGVDRAPDDAGTRCRTIEKIMKTECVSTFSRSRLQKPMVLTFYF